MTRSNPYPPASARLDWTCAILAFAFMCGLLLDGWSHDHYVTETFFTPAHAVFYAAFTLLAVVTLGTAWRNHARGYPWNRSLPRGYVVSLWAILLFFPGIAGDFTWHLIVGPEKSLGALLSPTHLYLAINLAIILTGPLRAALADPPAPRLRAQLPMLLSASAFFMLLQFFTQYAFAFDAGFSRAMAPAGYLTTERTNDIAQIINVFYREIDGLFAVIVHAAIVSGVVVFLTRSLRLAPGAFTVLFVLSLCTVAAMPSHDLVTYGVNAIDAVLTGVVADVLYARMQPARSIRAFRAFCALVPGFHYAAFFGLEALLAGGTWWEPNLVLGSIVIPAAIGLLLAVLASQPAETAWQTS